jgi:hypothetical protein
MVVLVIMAGVGGYFVGLIQGAGIISINMSNNSTGNVFNSSSPNISTYNSSVVTISTAKSKLLTIM